MVDGFPGNLKRPNTSSGGIDIEAPGADFNRQFMLVIAFLINALTVFWIARKWQANPIKLWMIFLIFWFVDALVPWLYQTFIFSASSIPTVIILGFFAPVIIVISTRMNYRTFEMAGRT